MAIKGLTHSDEGVAIQRLPVSIKVAIGEGPDPADPKSHPKKSDHFLFKRKTMKGKDVAWESDVEVTKRYGANCREVGVVFMDDDIENVFRTRLAWWKATEVKCSGELVQIDLNGKASWEMKAVRKTDSHPEGEDWPGNYKYTEGAKKGQPVPGCGDGCPDLEEGRCKPSADLYFQLDKFPMLGAVCRLHTSSYRSIRQISSALQQVMQTFGGLSGVRMVLKVRPEKGTYVQDGAKKSTTLQILSLELDADDWKKLLSNATEMKRMFLQQRNLIGARRVEIVEDDNERAAEIAGEFAPDDRALPAASEPVAGVPKADIPSMEEVAQRSAIHRLCGELGFNQAKEDMLIGQHKGRLGELETNLKNLCVGEVQPAKAEAAKAAAPAKTETRLEDRPKAAKKTGFSF